MPGELRHHFCHGNSGIKGEDPFVVREQGVDIELTDFGHVRDKLREFDQHQGNFVYVDWWNIAIGAPQT